MAVTFPSRHNNNNNNNIFITVVVIFAVLLSHKGCVSCFTLPLSSFGSVNTMFCQSSISLISKSRSMIYGRAAVRNFLEHNDRPSASFGTSSSSSSRLYMSKGKKRNDGLLRADRVLSNRGWGSRSECFDLLKQRRVYQKIESEMKKILGPSEKISMDASLWVDGKQEVPKPPPLLRVYHKPKWVLSVMNDSKGRKNLSDLDFISKMHPVGRLDYDTSGLLLFSSDGILTNTLLHPTKSIQKEYVAVVMGKVNEDELREVLKKGVQTSLGIFPADLVEAIPIPDEDIQPRIDDIINKLPPEYDVEKLEEKGFLFFKKAKAMTQVRLIVEEGKHRMVRKILANSGFPVISLKRERLGTIVLEGLEEGAYRDLTPQEEEWALSLLKDTRKEKKPPVASEK